MLRTVLLTSVLTTYAAPAASQEELVGLWSVGDCEDQTSLDYQGYTVAVYHDENRFQVLPLEVLKTGIEDWYLIRTDDTDPFPSVAHVEDGDLVHAWLKDELSAEDRSVAHASLLDGSLNPVSMPDEFDIDRLIPCAGLPLSASILFGEQFAVLRGIDEALWSCRRDASTCADRFFQVADLSGDAELSVAELSRVFRSSVALGAAMESSNSNELTAGATAFGFAIAPIVSAAVLHSFDYDNSGTVSFQELLSERLPAEWAQAGFEAGSFSAVLQTLNDLAESADSLAGNAFR